MRRSRKAQQTRTALVAGGAGFLGSHLCEALFGIGYRVICIDNFLTGRMENITPLIGQSRFRLIEQDICSPLELGEPVDRVFNLACAASPPRYQADPVHTTRTCVVGSLNLLELAVRDGARFLQASTSEVYGDPEQHPQREDYLGHVNCTGPRACYDEGKRTAETLCFDYLRADRADVRVARIFNTYGPRMDPADGRIVSNLVMQALEKRPMTIFGDGRQTRSFCYVTDLVEGLLRLMDIEPNPRQPINLGNPGEFTVLELAGLVRELTGTRSPVKFLPLPEDDPRRRRPDIARAKELLGWAPKVPLRQGLLQTVVYFAELDGSATVSPATATNRSGADGVETGGPQDPDASRVLFTEAEHPTEILVGPDNRHGERSRAVEAISQGHRADGGRGNRRLPATSLHHLPRMLRQPDDDASSTRRSRNHPRAGS
ncbi:MAG: SDR family oxidoreductase [Mesorhizobium sp.]|nr:SDR family oxidoreductase [Mesorhizobium sp. M1A.F.Ca.IN.022.06.1.1]OBQ96562.1 NAD-dependent dehydratase [Mesorhizobium sp. AA23]PBB29077.1 NAD-dependent epimerase/dehydratase family protein [Mesorhizobium sp. WSM3882]RUV08473.1 SDR family oxidoreductase [Mesorhizobium sp. M1A.F.Ca.IN.020.03.2.1]RUV27482.1 SDR family oxidoreductase [Mesorhizobium sp. M1A.F.Ca.IN.022.04.1.1]RUV79573.1 SDR family oxidoreductase [Mesorhizobium sp. M1A.F.Ca.IN.020.30.1.1]RUV89825.1 SDR family oxidoreductase [M